MKPRLFLALALLLPALLFADISARNGVAITTASTVNGITPVAALNGLTVTAGAGGGDYRTNLLLELLADTEVSEGGTDGSTVQTWTDTSGNGHDATQATSGQRPTLKTGIVNGHAVLRWDGVDDWISGTFTHTGTALTVFAVLSLDTSAAGYCRMVSLGAAATADETSTDYTPALLRINSTTTVAGWRNGQKSAGALTYSTFVLLTSKFDGTNHTLYIDGVAQSAVASTGSFNISAYRIGHGLSDGDALSQFKGDQAQVRVYSAALADADRETVEDFLGSYYGITITH